MMWTFCDPRSVRCRSQRVCLAMPCLAVGVLLAAGGCGDHTTQTPVSVSAAQAAAQPPAARLELRIVKPQRKTVRRAIEQPGFNIEAYQQTPLYAKISGFVDQWKVDIGDSVSKGQLLAELLVPEMDAELEQKEAAVRVATAQVAQARAIVLTSKAQLDRAKSQFERLEKVGRGGILDRENVDEVRLTYAAAKAGLEKADADVAAAEARLDEAKANRQYTKAMRDYAQIRAPYDGVVVQRNINSGDFVQPAASGEKGLPLFVINQVDPVRVFLQIPGADAAWIKDGDPVTLRLQGAAGQSIAARITRNARSLNPDSRTLRTEIDLPNPRGELMPGMYVQAVINVEHAGFWTLPAEAVVTEGSEAICYRLVSGRAVRTPLQIGLRGGGLVEVVNVQMPPESAETPGPWRPLNGDERILVGNLASLSDGQVVQASEAHAKGGPGTPGVPGSR